MVELLEVERCATGVTGSEVSSHLPSYDSLASQIAGPWTVISKSSPGQTNLEMSPSEVLLRARNASIGWSREDWRLPGVQEFETSMLTFASLPLGAREVVSSRRGGRKISLREAWELAGRIFEEAEEARQEGREMEAQQFFGSKDTGLP